MPENNLYEYAVIRYCPNIERAEFINVGLLMMCKRQRWMSAQIHLPQDRLQALRAAHSTAEIQQQLRTFTDIAAGNPTAGPMAAMPVEERFRWLTAVKSACLQTSRPHPGLTPNLEHRFQQLFQQLVL